MFFLKDFELCPCVRASNYSYTLKENIRVMNAQVLVENGISVLSLTGEEICQQEGCEL